MRILVTDATGPVGRPLAGKLLAAGHTVSGIAEHHHDCLDPEVDFVCAPLDHPVLQELADDADVVFHLAPVEFYAPGSAGLAGVVRLTHAAARAGARLLFVSQAAGQPELYRQAEQLVSSGWAPSLIIRMAPPVGRQLDWMECRTVATLLRTRTPSRSVRLLHVEDLIRFLVQATANDRTGTVDLATPDTVDVTIAQRLLRSVDHRPRIGRVPSWPHLAIDLDISALQQDWHFECGWTATAAIADTAAGLMGRRLGVAGATSMAGHLPVPRETGPRWGPSDGTALQCAAPDGLEGEFDDRIDPRFPIFSASSFAEALPGPLTPMTLDVQVSGLRLAAQKIGQVMALRGPLGEEWDSRAIAVFGHRVYLGVSSSALTANRVPGWDERDLTGRSLGGQSPELFPFGRPRLSMPGFADGAVGMMRAVTTLRHLKADTRSYSAAAIAAHLDHAHLASLSDARLEVRAQLLRDRIHHGWSLTALWLINTGVTATALKHTAAGGLSTASGFAAVAESAGVAAELAPLAYVLSHDRRLAALAAHGDLDGIRAASPSLAAGVNTAVVQMAHRGLGEAELGNRMFGDDPAILLAAAGSAVPAVMASSVGPATVTDRMAATARASHERAYDATMRFTHELRMTLRKMGSRRVSAELIEAADDVYYLTLAELVVMPADVRLRIKRRRAERERLQTVRLPIVIHHSWAPLDGSSQP